LSVNERNVSITNAVKHYNALFSLPSHKSILFLLVFTVPLICGLIYVVYFFSILKIIQGVLFGLFSFVYPSLILDFSLNRILGSSDPLLTRRRLSAISLFQIGFWLVPSLSVALISLLLPEPLSIEYSLSIGFGFAVALRLSVFYSVSTLDIIQVHALSIIQPVVSIFAMFLFWGGFDSKLLSIVLLSGILGFVGAWGFMLSLDSFGIQKIGMPAFRLLRIFIVNWTEGVREPLEEFLEEISNETNLSIVLLAFRSSGRIKAILAIPNFHPGPFKNVGSSSLPFLLEKTIAHKTDSFVSVVHGTSGHEHDLPSQAENEKFISTAISLLNFDNFSPYATVMNRHRINRGKASCQRFGGGLLVTLTRAPESTEDLPKEVGEVLTDFASNQGLNHVGVVDSHNCIDDEWILPSKEVEDLIDAARRAMSISSNDSLSKFQVGVSKLYPETYSLDQGIGLGGISVILIETQGFLSCYVTVDGNNMIRGLREKILERISSLGISGGEVFTTDTHSVNALSLSQRGYHPIGEVIDHELFIDQIYQTVDRAFADLEPAEAAWNSGQVKNIKVFGLESLRSQLNFIHDAINYAKIAAIISYGSCLIIFSVIFSRMII